MRGNWLSVVTDANYHDRFQGVTQLQELLAVNKCNLQMGWFEAAYFAKGVSAQEVDRPLPEPCYLLPKLLDVFFLIELAAVGNGVLVIDDPAQV